MGFTDAHYFLHIPFNNGYKWKKIKNTEIQTIKPCFNSGSSKLFFCEKMF